MEIKINNDRLERSYNDVAGDKLITLQRLQDHEKNIHSWCKTQCRDYILLGSWLNDIALNQLYKYEIYSDDKYCKNIYQYCEAVLYLKKSSCYNLMAVMRKFTDGVKLKSQYEGFTYSVLVEMLPDIEVPAQCNMTVKEVRNLNKEARQTDELADDPDERQQEAAASKFTDSDRKFCITVAGESYDFDKIISSDKVALVKLLIDNEKQWVKMYEKLQSKYFEAKRKTV